MDNPNRINPTAMTVSVGRQSPKNEFGDVLSNTLQSVVAAGGALANALPGVPAISAAVSSVTAFANGGSTRTTSASTANGIVNLGGSGGIAGGPSHSAGAELSTATPTLADMQRTSQYYLEMQNAMQQESRSYNAVSNIIKVRHDSAKAAINNIR